MTIRRDILTSTLIRESKECPGCVSGDSGEAKCIFCNKCVLGAEEIIDIIYHERFGL